MEIISIKSNKKRIIDAISQGLLLIHPTDTIYGIGCNAFKPESVEKVRELKATNHPFSVIAPSKAWIEENLIVKHPEFLERLPGRVTLILEKKNPSLLKECSLTNKLGVRIPDHEFYSLVREAGVPFVTTSANISGKPSITGIDEMPERFKTVDLAIDSGVLEGDASRIFDITEEPKEIKRSQS